MEGRELDRLAIPLMTPHNRERMRTAYTISVDARDQISTGISAADRARTIKVLVDSASEPFDLVQPGHVFPLRYRDGGVLVRPGHTEASVDLARLAGLTPAGAIAELVNDDGTMKRGQQLRDFADEHGLVLVSIADLIRYRRRTESQIERVATTPLPTSYGDFVALGFRNTVDGTEHMALVHGELGRRRRSGAAALGVPDRGRVRLAAVRLRAAARRRAAHDRRRGRGAGLPARARGPWHRAAAQAARLPAAGRRPGHRRREPRPRTAGRRPGLRQPARRSWPSWA